MKKFDISNLIISKIVDVYSVKLEEETRAHGVLSHCVLVIKRQGESLYKILGREYTADANNVLFMPAGTDYSVNVLEEGECSIIEFDIQNQDKLSPCSYFIDNESEIIKTAKNISHYWDLQGPAYHSKCLSEMYSLITQISTIDSYTYSLAGKYRLIHRSVKYIEANYARQDLYTPMLAEMSDMGETYYRSIFISVFNMAPAKYIQNYRVGKAKELLINSEGSIEEIAVAVGFANSSYFCKVFKTITGLTPSEFAEKGRRLG
jgi:AraC-like DNA-binding protein